MNLQAEKLNLIEDLIRINDTEVIKKVKQLLNSASRKLEPMSLEKFYRKIDAAEKAIKTNELTDQDDLKKEIKNWGTS